MGHVVTSDDSDYFIGYCPCDQLPCLSCVAAQKRIEGEEKLRGKLIQIYYDHHKEWPQAAFIDDIIHVFEPATKRTI